MKQNNSQVIIHVIKMELVHQQTASMMANAFQIVLLLIHALAHLKEDSVTLAQTLVFAHLFTHVCISKTAHAKNLVLAHAKISVLAQLQQQLLHQPHQFQQLNHLNLQ
jgi:hypothetical protein